jgi:uncharacterized small protein (DUF1192 family)
VGTQNRCPFLPIAPVHDPDKACPGLDPGWNLFADKIMRQVNMLPRVTTAGPDAKILKIVEAPMPAIDDEDRPKKKLVHEIGQDLALLSVGELNDRIALLREEIARLEAVASSKKTSRDVAAQFFKK